MTLYAAFRTRNPDVLDKGFIRFSKLRDLVKSKIEITNSVERAFSLIEVFNEKECVYPEQEAVNLPRTISDRDDSTIVMFLDEVQNLHLPQHDFRVVGYMQSAVESPTCPHFVTGCFSGCTYELTNLDPTALMFQTGYITIKDVKSHDRITEFVFDFPNVEVKQSFLELIIIKYGQLSKDDYATDSLKLYHDLMHHRFGLAIQTIQDVFQRIPKLDHQSQQWFLQMFYMMIQSTCPHTRTITTLGDKMVIMIESNQSTILIAFTCTHAVKDLMLELNVNPIIHPLKLSDKDLYFVGISFDHQKREITDWTDEHVNPKPVEIPASQKAFVKIIKLFLASSGDLENERKEISLWINRKNKRLIKNNTFIDLVIWEDLLHSFQGQRIQDYFNQEMLTCDIVIALFYSKVGQFTKEEFDLAYSRLKAGQKPYYLFVGFKITPPRTVSQEYVEIIKLRAQIEQDEQLYITFESIDQLILQLDAQIETCIHQFGNGVIKP
jgi:hypothetical protein